VLLSERALAMAVAVGTLAAGWQALIRTAVAVVVNVRE